LGESTSSWQPLSNTATLAQIQRKEEKDRLFTYSP
jgi:hypothetical protein